MEGIGGLRKSIAARFFFLHRKQTQYRHWGVIMHGSGATSQANRLQTHTAGAERGYSHV